MVFPNRCVNCFITFNNLRIVSHGVLELDASIRDLLISWISPMEITLDHRICNECVAILQLQAQLDDPAREYGHKSVCLGCGVSMLRAKSIPINRNRDEFTIISSWVPQIQADLPIFTRLCRVCWRRASRAQAASIASPEEQEIEFNLHDVSIKTEDGEMPFQVSVFVQAAENPPRSPTPPPPPIPVLKQEEEEEKELQPQSETLALSTYTQVLTTSGRCIFSTCLNERLLLIPTMLRQRVLLDFKMYIPLCGRICSNHLCSDHWHNLKHEHLTDNFNSDEIEDMLYLSQLNNKGSNYQ